MTKKKSETYNSVWDAISDTPAEAANLRARSELMMQIAEVIKTKRWTQSQAASNCNITQPRMNDLLRGKVSNFSLDALVNIATAINREVQLKLKPIPSRRNIQRETSLSI